MRYFSYQNKFFDGALKKLYSLNELVFESNGDVTEDPLEYLVTNPETANVFNHNSSVSIQYIQINISGWI